MKMPANATPEEEKRTASINDALDELRKRPKHVPAKSKDLLDGPGSPVGTYFLFACLFASLAAVVYLLATREAKQPIPAPVADVPFIPAPVTELNDGTIVYKSQLYIPANSARAIAQQAPVPQPPQQSTIIRTTPRPQVPTSQVNQRPPSPPPAPAVTVKHHAAAAEAYALDYFRFKSDLAKNSASLTASINIKETKELPNWSRYGSKGEANITYVTSQGGFRTVSRSFEVYTEEKDGRAQGVDITVGF